MIKTGRKIAIIALPLLTLVSGVLPKFGADYGWLDWIFKIALSGTVGIWTNYFAIRMLFRPYRRTFFGRQGLIPARREDIAEAIAGAVAEELLDTDSILQYVEENGLVEKTASSALGYIHRWVDDPENRTRVVSGIASYARERGAEHAEQLLAGGAELVRNYANENLSADTVWSYARAAVERELDKPETLELLTIVVTRLVEDNASDIADAVNLMLEDWIESRGFIAKSTMKIGKGLFGVDSEMIRKELLKRVRKPSFVRNVMNLLEQNLSSVYGMADDPAVRERFAGFLEEQKDRLYRWVRTDGIAALRERLLAFVSSGTFWDWLEKQLDSVILTLKQYAERKVRSDEFRETVNRFLLEHISRIEIRDIVRRKVNEFDLRQLEELVTRVSGDNLCGIELFGGILGMLAGLILINQWFVIGIPLVLGLLWLLERSLTRAFTARKRSQAGR